MFASVRQAEIDGVLRSEWGAGAGTTVRPFVEEGCTTEEEI